MDDEVDGAEGWGCSERNQLDPKSTEVDSHEEFLEGFKFSCPCMVSRLMTVVKIYGFMGRECLSAIDGVDVRSLFEKQDKEIELGRFFLKQAVALKKMTFQFCEKPDFVQEEERLKILLMDAQKLTAIPRCSCVEMSPVYKYCLLPSAPPRRSPASALRPSPPHHPGAAVSPSSIPGLWGSWDARSRSFRFTAWLPRPASRRTSRWSPALAASSHRVGMEKMGNAKVAVGMQGRLVSRLPAVYLSSNRVGAAVMLLRAGTTTIGQ
ncbi:hypothetical protein AAC387_Pa12g1959 [Persea americana]